MRDLADVRREAAPTGRLRVALNHGNAVLVARGSDDAHPRGVSAALALALCERLHVEPDFLHYDRAADVAADAKSDVWDICFLAIDPRRAETIAFSEAYVAIEGRYAVRDDSPARSAAEIGAMRQRIGIVEGSAYALHLARAETGAELITFRTAADAVQALTARHLDGVAGVGQARARLVRENPRHRLIPDPFMTILQAVGVPADRLRAAMYVRQFVDEMKSSGLVARYLAESGHDDVRVP